GLGFRVIVWILDFEFRSVWVWSRVLGLGFRVIVWILDFEFRSVWVWSRV
ncbi:hypothetical protein LINGRAHAP2_LOCUS35352, partial [Linum grandiflorum]